MFPEEGGVMADLARPTRVQLRFEPTAMERLEDLQQRSGALNKAEVIRNALKFYEWVVENRGRTVLMQIGVDKIDIHLIPQSSGSHRKIMTEVREAKLQSGEMYFLKTHGRRNNSALFCYQSILKSLCPD